MLSAQKILMCPPDHFGVTYVINPWMEGHLAGTSRDLAAQQWQHLRREIEKHAQVVIQPAQPDLPDLVFTANAGLVWHDKAIVSRFRNPERQGEEPHDHKSFTQAGFTLVDWPQDRVFEGAGDALFDRGQELLWVGHGFRSHVDTPRLLAEKLNVKTVALTLRDPRFYHLDTCLCPLAGGYMLYFPDAFDAVSRAAIEAHVPPNKRIAVDEADALNFCCNAVDLNAHVIMNHASESLQKRLIQAGFTPVIVPLSEFMKAGGAAKCLTLKLVEV
jgi:N-dimethylarginine dimethylaminohydrolase